LSDAFRDIGGVVAPQTVRNVKRMKENLKKTTLHRHM